MNFICIFYKLTYESAVRLSKSSVYFSIECPRARLNAKIQFLIKKQSLNFLVLYLLKLRLIQSPFVQSYI
jgi:hypothetical protein